MRTATRPGAMAAVACLALSAAAAPAGAVPLFTPVVAATAAPVAATRGLSGVRRLRLDRRVLRDLRTRTDAVLDRFPLGDGSSATLHLRRFTPFPAGARIVIMRRDGAHRLHLPDAVYFSGAIAGEPQSRAVVIAGRRRAHGFVARDGDVFPFGPDGAGSHRVYSLRRADPAVYAPPRDFCANDLVPEQVGRAHAQGALPPPPDAATAPLRIAKVAIDTDNELRNKFASDEATLDYLASLLAEATAIYERDLNVRLEYSYVRLWAPETSDPWTKTDPSEALAELQQVWDNPFGGMYAISNAAALVHFVSGKPVHGGVSYVDRLCDSYWALGVSQVNGNFDLSNPLAIWDLLVFTHELGHTFGSEHTHCYDPPVDRCFNLESGCFNGTAEASRGTVMSYCYLQPGGLANIDLTFGPTVSARIAQSVAAASCLALASTTTTVTTSTSTTGSVTTSTTVASSTTTAPGATTTSTTDTTTTIATGATSSSTSTTTLSAGADGDADGIADAVDACPATPTGDLVGADGCSLCPCAGPRSGGAWRGRAQYLRCVRTAARQSDGLDDVHLPLRRAQQSSCGRPRAIRCCVPAAGSSARCRVTSSAACATRGADDLGAGSCLPSPCRSR